MFRRRGLWSGRRSLGTSSWGRSRERSVWRPLPLLLIGISVLLILELGLRAIAGWGWLGAEFTRYQGEPAEITAYRLQFVDGDRHPYAGLPAHGDLLATYHPLLGYDLLPDQQHEQWTINPQGFRDEEPVPLEKPPGEVRIFILGGAAAFGQFSESNQTTFAHLLEDKLGNRIALQTAQPDLFQPEVLPFRADQVATALAQQARIPNGTYRVINAAVPGYASGNELAELTQKILAYRPNLIILLHGYEDLRLPSTQPAATTVPQLDAFLANASIHLRQDVSQQFTAWSHQIYLVKALRSLTKPQSQTLLTQLVAGPSSTALLQQFTTDETELQARCDRYGRNLRAIAQITSNARIPTIVALQPELTGRSTLTAEEQSILSGINATDYRDRVAQGYAALADTASQVRAEFPQTLRALNLYTLFAQEPQAATFKSPIHLTQLGHEALAQHLFEKLVEALRLTPRDFGT